MKLKCFVSPVDAATVTLKGLTERCCLEVDLQLPMAVFADLDTSRSVGRADLNHASRLPLAVEHVVGNLFATRSVLLDRPELVVRLTFTYVVDGDRRDRLVACCVVCLEGQDVLALFELDLDLPGIAVNVGFPVAVVDLGSWLNTALDDDDLVMVSWPLSGDVMAKRGGVVSSSSWISR